MFTNLFYAALAAVIGVAVMRGGRPERRVALVLLAANLANGVAQAVLHHTVPAEAFLVIDGVVATSLVRTVMFRPQAWSAVVLGAQFVVIALDLVWLAPGHPRGVVYQHAVYVLAYLQLAGLLSGTLTRWIGPPLKP